MDSVGSQPQLSRPERGEVHLWWASLVDARNHPPLVASWLSAAERERADRLHNREKRARNVASRVLLRGLLSRYVGVPPGGLQFVKNPAGKPGLAGSEGDLEFNVSHSGNLWVCAVTSGQPVGIDVEGVRPLSPQHVLPFLAPEEQAAWETAYGAPWGSEGVIALFALWTRKEAYIKGRGLGFHLPLNAFAVTVDPDHPPRLRYDRRDPEATTTWTLADLHHFPGVYGALAISGPLRTLRLRNVQFESGPVWG